MLSSLLPMLITPIPGALAAQPAAIYADADISAAAGDSYSIDFQAADPVDYLRLTPGSLACPGGGRVTDPLIGAQHADGVESLAPSYLGLGQVVAFEFLINVDAGGPTDGSIEFTAGWDTQTRKGK